MSGLANAGVRKPCDYYANDRPNLTGQLRHPLGRVLDIGCGAGGVGAVLRDLGASHLTGIEIDCEAASVAERQYDVVHVAPTEVVLPTLAGAFDTVLCYDVLEHLADPAAALVGLRAVVASNGQLHVSVPNARHLSLLRDLVLRGTFGYTLFGHRDSTHLRWFTRRDLIDLLEATRWRVEAVSASVVGRSRMLDRATFGAVREFAALQWHVLATPTR
jgi:2-polyprenyl-3-methyl-5-hydroxy-6-metoxy-1,4-benzoquinol methylase